jgi:hypothetical protein
MASELTVQTLRGPTSGANADTVLIPSGQTLHAPGHVINVTHGQHNAAGMSQASTGWVEYTPSRVTVTKKLGSGQSYLMVMAAAWIEYGVAQAHLSYSLMRDSVEVTNASYGLGNLYSSINASGAYQSSADMSWVDTTSLAAGNYVYSVAVKSHNSATIQIGNGGRLGTMQILEIAQ